MNIFEQNIINIYGDEGRNWLKNLPGMVNSLAAQYGISNLSPVTNLTYNYVLEGFQGTQPIILKCGLDSLGIKREAAALKEFSGTGSVKLLAEGEQMLLLERIIPGESLKSYWPDKDNEALKIVIDIMYKLYNIPLPKPHIFPTIIDWLTALDRDINIPRRYLEKARLLKNSLLNTCSAFKLLHGDLHHGNILNNKDEWLVIDPKGVIGEPAYELAYFIRNPIPELLHNESATHIINWRAVNSAKFFDITPQRILNWSFVQSVLSWIWALEDGSNDVTYFHRLTEIMDPLVVL